MTMQAATLDVLFYQIYAHQNSFLISENTEGIGLTHHLNTAWFKCLYCNFT